MVAGDEADRARHRNHRPGLGTRPPGDRNRLYRAHQAPPHRARVSALSEPGSADRRRGDGSDRHQQRIIAGQTAFSREDRKSVVPGKSVSDRVDLGGRRTLKKKKPYLQRNINTTTLKTPPNKPQPPNPHNKT